MALVLLVLPVLGQPAAAEEGFTNRLGMRFVYIPPGAFLMGSPPGESGRQPDEVQHRVVISKGFYMATTEVTQGQWKKLMGSNPSAFQELGDNGPVNQVSWRDCQVFIARLNALAHTDRYRLPTEAQWEYACRADSQSAFARVNLTKVGCQYVAALAKIAWYCGDSGFKPHRVAQLAPNAWGLYDMHGNVAEWCRDACRWRNIWSRRVNVITDTYRDNITDPVSVTGGDRVFRGGSWNQSPQYLRSADRCCFNPGVRRSDLGFRVIALK